MRLAEAVVVSALLIGASVSLAMLWMLFADLRQAGGRGASRMGVFVWAILGVEALLTAFTDELVSAGRLCRDYRFQ